MGWFGLGPQSVAARSVDGGRAGAVRVPALGASVVRGAVGFTLVSVAGFLPWAASGRWLPEMGEVWMYVVCAAVFVGLAGPAMHRLIIGPGTLWRFYAVFTPAFVAYATVWTLCWMTWPGDLGGIGGLLGGAVAMGTVLVAAFEAWRELWKTVPLLFVSNAAGYEGGGWVASQLASSHGLAAMLAWGACFGLGFGAGIGLAFYLCQTRTRALLGTGQGGRATAG